MKMRMAREESVGTEKDADEGQMAQGGLDKDADESDKNADTSDEDAAGSD